VITTEALDSPRYELAFQNLYVRVYRNREALPRAYLVRDFRAGLSDAQALELLASGTFDFSRSVILSEPLAPELAAQLSPSAAAEPGRVEINRYETDRVEIEVQTGSAGLLVMSDAYYPGWSAEVDGQQAPLLRANHAFRAVFVPPGKHSVVFVYRSFSFQLGLGMTLVALLCLAAFTAKNLLR
jgi:hypothetical protein